MKSILILFVLASSSVAVADVGKVVKPPKGSPCVSIEEDKGPTWSVWLDAQGRPIHAHTNGSSPHALAWSYDAAGWMIKYEWEILDSSGVVEWTYGEHGELLAAREQNREPTKTWGFDDKYTWAGTFHSKASPPSYARMFPMLPERTTPEVRPSVAYDPPRFTGTVTERDSRMPDDNRPSTWTFDDAKRTIVSARGFGKPVVMTTTPTKDGFKRVITNGGDTVGEQTWSGGKIVSWVSTKSGATATATYDDRGRWISTKGTGFEKSYRVTYSCK